MYLGLTHEIFFPGYKRFFNALTGEKTIKGIYFVIFSCLIYESF